MTTCRQRVFHVMRQLRAVWTVSAQRSLCHTDHAATLWTRSDLVQHWRLQQTLTALSMTCRVPRCQQTERDAMFRLRSNNLKISYDKISGLLALPFILLLLLSSPKSALIRVFLRFWTRSEAG